jgi:HK97 family phage prohead protease
VSVHTRRLAARIEQTGARFAAHAAANSTAVADLPRVKLPWYEIRNTAGDAPDETPTVFIFDEIGGSFGVSAEEFARDLEAIDAPAITVRINSPGGSLFDGIAIYNALNHHPATIAVYIDGLAASAASIVAMGGDEVVMMPGSQLMIHDAAAVEDGNAADMAKMSTFLDRQSDNIADIYRLRAGGDVSEWRALMLAETWMFADEAVEMRLADRVQDPKSARTVDDELAALMRRSFDLGRYRYAGRTAAPAPNREAAVRSAARTTARSSRRPVDEPSAPDKAARAHGKGRQTRSYPAQYEVRGLAGTGVQVRGYATVYEVFYEMWDAYGPYSERVRRGAGTKTLSENPLVQFLTNHAGLSMAYTRAGTLRLGEDSTGLEVIADLDHRRGDVNDLVLAIERGDVDEMSFAFTVPTGKSIWSADYDQRDITEYSLHRGDVGAVNFGANSSTFIGMRGEDLDHMEEKAARAMYERLGRRLTVVDLAARVPAALGEAATARADALGEQPAVEPAERDDAEGPDTACPTCTAPNTTTALFCNQCGTVLASESVDTPAGEQPTTQPPAAARLALSLREQAADQDAEARTRALAHA